MPRYSATIRFDAESFEDARAFARGLRDTARRYERHEWNDANAKLLKLRDPQAETAATQS